MTTSSTCEIIVVETQDSESEDINQEEDDDKGNTQKKTSHKRQYQWNPARYIAFLCIIILWSPFSAPFKKKGIAWDKIAQDYNVAMKEPDAINGRKAKEKFDDLLSIFRKKEAKSLCKSGMNEEYTELDLLLEELDELERDYKAENENSKKKIELEEIAAENIRLAAMKSRKERAHLAVELGQESEHETDSETSQTIHPKKKARLSKPSVSAALLNILQEDTARNDEMMKSFLEGVEQDRLYHKERLEYEHRKDERQYELQEREYALKMHQLDLQFAELEEKRLERKQQQH